MMRLLGPAMRLRRRSEGSRSGLNSGVISTGDIAPISLDNTVSFDNTASVDGLEQRDDVRLGVREGQGQHRTAVLAEHARVTGGLGLDELAERERTARDLEVLRRLLP